MKHRRNDPCRRPDSQAANRSRTRPILNAQEQTTVYPTNSIMLELVNESRRTETLRQAEYARRANDCVVKRRQAPIFVAAMRQRMGLALVRTGQRVHGAPTGADAVTSLPAALRTAR